MLHYAWLPQKYSLTDVTNEYVINTFLVLSVHFIESLQITHSFTFSNQISVKKLVRIELIFSDMIHITNIKHETTQTNSEFHQSAEIVCCV